METYIISLKLEAEGKKGPSDLLAAVTALPGDEDGNNLASFIPDNTTVSLRIEQNCR